MEIRLLDNKSIDKKAWDQCLHRSPGFELYMQSAYLDVVFPNWKALVVDEYLAIFPVFEKKFLFWKLLRQPLFTGPCAIIGSDADASKIICDYLPKLFNNFHWVDLNLIEEIPNLSASYQKSVRKFQKLIIQESGYSPDGAMKKNLKRAGSAELENLVPIEANQFIQAVKDHLLINYKVLSSSGLNLLHNIIKQREKFNGVCVALSNQEQSFYAAQFNLSGHKKLYNVLSINSEEGRKFSASHALQIKLIDRCLPSGGELHFGGSNIERVAEYNKNYGAKDVYYTRIMRKNFPFTFLP